MDREALRAEACRLYQSGLTQYEVATQLGNSQWMASNALRRAGIRTRDSTLAIRAYTKSKTYDKDKDCFKPPLTCVGAWVLGWMVSDGCIRKGNQIVLLLASRDEEVLYKIKDFFKYGGPIKRSSMTLRGKTFYRSTLRFSSNEIYDDLRRLGVQENKSLCETYPDIGVDEELNRCLIRGIFEGDGCLTKNGNSYVVRIVGTKEMLDSIRSAIRKYTGVYSGHMCKNTKRDINHYVVHFRGNQQSMKIMDWIYCNAEFYLERKFSRYLEFKRYRSLLMQKSPHLYRGRS